MNPDNSQKRHIHCSARQAIHPMCFALICFFLSFLFFLFREVQTGHSPRRAFPKSIPYQSHQQAMQTSRLAGPRGRDGCASCAEGLWGLVSRSSREGRIRVPTFSVVYFRRVPNPPPQSGKRALRDLGIDPDFKKTAGSEQRGAGCLSILGPKPPLKGQPGKKIKGYLESPLVHDP